jgi:hypothetical protein
MEAPLIRGVGRSQSGGGGFMKSVWRGCVLGIAGLVAVGSAHGATLQVYAGGKLRGAFTPGDAPHSTGGPSLSVYLLDQRDVKTADGKVVTGFAFTGWRERGGVRVQVFVLVPAEGSPNTYLPGGKEESLTRREFSRHLVGPTGEVAVTKMRELGVEPMVLRLR